MTSARTTARAERQAIASRTIVDRSDDEEDEGMCVSSLPLLTVLLSSRQAGQ
jgi:hypothetical protein